MNKLACPVCQKDLVKKEEGFLCLNCSVVYKEQDGVINLLPPLISDLKKGEAQYHTNFEEDSLEVHQLLAWRNFYYHQKIWNFFDILPKDSHILEIGGGGGFDAEQILKKFNLTETDLALGNLIRFKKKITAEQLNKTVLVVADAENLPFLNDSFDGVFLTATWHHLENPLKGLQEIKRVLKPGGLAVLGIEPNYLYFNLLKKMQKPLYKITRATEDHSPADEEMSGFKKQQLIKLIKQSGWENFTIQPMWLMAGFIHYFLEFIFRAFRLKKRIVLPMILEKIIVAGDELVFKIPGLNHLGWHWNIFLIKNKK